MLGFDACYWVLRSHSGSVVVVQNRYCSVFITTAAAPVEVIRDTPYQRGPVLDVLLRLQDCTGEHVKNIQNDVVSTGTGSHRKRNNHWLVACPLICVNVVYNVVYNVNPISPLYLMPASPVGFCISPGIVSLFLPTDKNTNVCVTDPLTLVTPWFFFSSILLLVELVYECDNILPSY
jgi:hypothetical protein